MEYDFSYLTGGSHKVFVGVYPPQDIIDNFRDTNRKFVKEARNFNFIELDQIHFTLQFLGNGVSTNSLTLIANKLQDFASNTKASLITLDKLMFGFPSQRIAKLMFWNIVQTREFNHFTRELHKNIKGLDLPDVQKFKDHSKLIHHITVALLKNNTSKSYTRTISEMITELNLEKIEFPLKEFSLIRSELNRKGRTVYKSIATFKTK